MGDKNRDVLPRAKRYVYACESLVETVDGKRVVRDDPGAFIGTARRHRVVDVTWNGVVAETGNPADPLAGANEAAILGTCRYNGRCSCGLSVVAVADPSFGYIQDDDEPEPAHAAAPDRLTECLDALKQLVESQSKRLTEDEVTRAFELNAVPEPMIAWAKWVCSGAEGPKPVIGEAGLRWIGLRIFDKVTGTRCVGVTFRQKFGEKQSADFAADEVLAFGAPATLKLDELPADVRETVRRMAATGSYAGPRPDGWAISGNSTPTDDGYVLASVLVVRQSDNAHGTFDVKQILSRYSAFPVSDLPTELVRCAFEIGGGRLWSRDWRAFWPSHEGAELRRRWVLTAQDTGGAVTIERRADGMALRTNTHAMLDELMRRDAIQSLGLGSVPPPTLASALVAETGISVDQHGERWMWWRNGENAVFQHEQSGAVGAFCLSTIQGFVGSLNAPKGETMTEGNKIIELIKTDATDAAWRTAGSQFIKLTRDPLCALLSRHLAPNDEALRGRIAQFLQTEVGTAILASMLAMAMSAVPLDNAVRERMARELRVRSLADAGDLVAEIVMGPLRQVMSLYLQDPAGTPLGVAPAAPAIPAPAPASGAAIGVREAAKVER